MRRTIKRLNKELEDSTFRQGWIANMTQCYMDAEDQYRNVNDKNYMNRADRHTIALKASYRFLELLQG
jgi:hypothetical protein